MEPLEAEALLIPIDGGKGIGFRFPGKIQIPFGAGGMPESGVTPPIGVEAL
jgi:hypothetical protein